MDKTKREFLEAAGWKVGTVAELLNMTPDEWAEVEKRIADESLDVQEVENVQ